MRARKHKLVEFEGEMLFQRRDDDVPIFLLKPIQEIRSELNEKIDSIKRCGSASPQATSVILDKKAYGLNVPKGATPRSSVSRSPSPNGSKASSPVRDTTPVKTENNTSSTQAAKETTTAKIETAAPPKIEASADKTEAVQEIAPPTIEITDSNNATESPAKLENSESPSAPQSLDNTNESPAPIQTEAQTEVKSDVNNNNDNLPTIVIEATAVYNGSAKSEATDATTESNATTPSDNTETTAASA